MEMKELKYIFLFFTSIVILIGVLCCFNECVREKEEPTTITLYDTVFIDKERIVEHTNTKYITKIDTFYIKGDTIKDTIFLKELPIEHKEYIDTISTDSTRSIVRALYSGFNPQIDNLYVSTEIVSKKALKYPKMKKWGWNISGGIYGGYGLGSQGLSPQIGVGVSIGFGYRIK